MRAISFFSGLLLVGCSSVQTPPSFDAKNWRYATDPHGSQVILTEPLVQENRVKIGFDRVPRVDKQNNSWVELIYDIPQGNLNGLSRIEVTYQSDNPLVIKLSQKEYGGAGDKSYAHYQVILPQAMQPLTREVTLSDFTRPDWTPHWSKDKGIINASVSALYFVPDLTDRAGGSATMTIHQLTLK
ncbi:hypothetical protein [Pseudoalteromonas luteoviolacea]|uniref:Lipoprotein n=1 Tax=Pseudoalteromonas luteoviolacea S4054 TaxID=1129367 RepID=A0A0F6AB13_9GAMM|nr:hypothetical protein [Pseudoalteromonas luteoviolacea]AOT07071.1 hypothetical protein S4054249_03925 [Pseudoalteromonas luteoviolacea]AOT11988.1 hypothetical protein S40542_03925 [Pseudoalteromonas luteoviolacea]AOT16901.1 hypothetical protein S4054_03925 [Pseudoalteromonas luteoviolacea]KKE82599.1 hypothetical protein N479_17465 [Pseudoalteromonas luteoviolacea S4054]KZN69967.1 hypothetical protein N481_21360 [Pseudoalteromonas luteoviolacea S4047-1]